MCAKSLQSYPLPPYELSPARFLCPWGSPGKNTGVGCHFFLQRIFLNPYLLRLLRWQAGFLPLGTEAKPGAGCSHSLAQSDQSGGLASVPSHQPVTSCGHPGAGNCPR